MASLLFGMLWGYIGIVWSIDPSWLAIFVGFFIALIGSIYKKYLHFLLNVILQIIAITTVFALGKYILHMYYHNELIYEGYAIREIIKIYLFKLFPSFFPDFISHFPKWISIYDLAWYFLMVFELFYFSRLEQRIVKKTPQAENADYMEKRFSRGKRKDGSWLNKF